MNKFDLRLANDGVIISRRPYKAYEFFCKKFNIIYSFNTKKSLDDNIYTVDDIFPHIMHWYTKNYGDRLKPKNFSGELVILIRGTPWRVRFPITWGKRAINIQNCIVGFTSEYAARLDTKELAEIKGICQNYYSIFTELKSIYNETFIFEAFGDLYIAIETILSSPPHYGLSKWHSLQFVEKLLKSYMAKYSIEFDINHHKLKKYNKIATKNGTFKPIPSNILQKIQCSAAIRYNESGLKIQDAVNAHHASLQACAHIIIQFSTSPEVHFQKTWPLFPKNITANLNKFFTLIRRSIFRLIAISYK